MTQLAAIWDIFDQLAMPQPPAAMPAPSTPPTIEWVVDTGAPMAVARLSHSAPASKAAIIIQTKTSVSPIRSGSMMLLLIVPTTSPPAISAPAASQTAAINMAPDMVRAREPTAGPMLLATSLAPMFMAM